jgi:hypothetical protein
MTTSAPSSSTFGSQQLQSWILDIQCYCIGVTPPDQLDEPESLISVPNVVNTSALKKACSILNKTQWEHVVDGRKSEGRCGWPNCANAPRSQSQLASSAASAFIARLKGSSAAVSEWMSRDHFCSAQCEAQSTLIHRLLPVDPIWHRSEADSIRAALRGIDWSAIKRNSSATQSVFDSIPTLPSLQGMESVFQNDGSQRAAESSSPVSAPDAIHIIERDATHTAPSTPMESLATNLVEGYTPKISLKTATAHQDDNGLDTHNERRANTHKESSSDMEDSDDLSDDDLEALYTGAKPNVTLPQLSDFGLLFSALDGWFGFEARRYLGLNSNLSSDVHSLPKNSAQEGPEVSNGDSERRMPAVDGAVTSDVKRSAMWAQLKPKLESSLHAYTRFSHRTFDHALLVRDVQSLVLHALEVEGHDPLPLQSRHWTLLALVILSIVSRRFHPEFHGPFTEYVVGSCWPHSREEWHHIVNLLDHSS